MLRVVSGAAMRMVEAGDKALAGGRLEEAEGWFRQALMHDRNVAAGWCGLGDIAAAVGRREEALRLYREGVSADAGDVDAEVKLAKCLMEMEEVDEALARFGALCVPGRNLGRWAAGVWVDLGNTLRWVGRTAEAVEAYRRGVAAAPELAGHHSALLYGMHFVPGMEGKELLAEHLRWNEAHVGRLRGTRKAFGARRSGGKLRAGFVSPDFDSHVVGRFMEPFLREHDRERVEVTCYSGTTRTDRMTEKLRGYAGRWREIAAASDEAAAEQIRADEIDVLVDLTMHMERSRLLVFGRRPAPVQATYLAYCSTTGVETIDYRLSDGWLDPVGEDESIYSERTVRLPETYWCYTGWSEAPEAMEWGSGNSGEMVFGSMNHFAKVSEGALVAWGKILRRVEGSRLKILCPRGQARSRVLGVMEEQGVKRERVEFVDRAGPEEYFRTMGSIHVHLDPFVYSGGTTTCDGLWMGTPTVTLRGKLAVARGGASLMSNAGLGEWVARDEAEYVEIAVRQAGDVEGLRALRRGMRERVRSSVVGDAKRFARGMEQALLEMRERGPARR
ncbi:MAG TPA: tetratricopeptide repeat protein [Phycisphaerae bacterium]|nr:tetratricopeptide repeat protein [Phycisphaerae bacterium]